MGGPTSNGGWLLVVCGRSFGGLGRFVACNEEDHASYFSFQVFGMRESRYQSCYSVLEKCTVWSLGHCLQCRGAGEIKVPGAVAWFGNDCHRDVKDGG